MTLRSGKLTSSNALTAGSMARSIERALEDLVPLGANEDPLARRKLVLAIARGVLEHLRDNIGSLHVTVPNTGGGVGTHQQSPTIDVDLGGWS
ncbi:MAG TPA: hypothetical protein VF461_14775 [Gemmatimonadaceae bacterium]